LSIHIGDIPLQNCLVGLSLRYTRTQAFTITITEEVILRVHPGTRSLKGVLASKKGKGMSFAQIREAAATAARNRKGIR
jgi:hypothetical protein